MSVAARCDETERPGAARTWWTTGQRSTCISNSRRLHNYTQLAPPSYYNRLGHNGTAFQIVGSLSEAVSSHSMWGVPPCKSLLHAPVSARRFSCTAGRALIRSWATGRGALRWVCTRLSFGEARHATLSSIPPTSNHSLVIHGALAVVVLSSSRRRPVVCGPRRSAAIGPCGLARGLSPLSSRTGHCPHCVAVALRWRARGACNGGSLCGHLAHTHEQVTSHSYYRTSQPPRTHRARLDRGPAQWV